MRLISKTDKKNKLGFTLIELLVVIAIFVLIANTAMVYLNKARRESRDAQRSSDINQIRSALHLYSIENNFYPPASSIIALGTDGHLIIDSTGFVSSNPTSPIFMYSVPRDPKMKKASSSSPCTSSSTSFCDYSYLKVGNDYEIYFYLEGPVAGKEAGLYLATKDTILKQ